MKKLITLAALLSLSACGTTAIKSTPQNYRAKGETNTVSIKSNLVVKDGAFSNQYAVVFTINEVYALGFQLDTNGNGSLSCDSEIKDKDGLFYCAPYQGKKIGAVCMGSSHNTKLTRENCAFSIDGENAANFSF